MKQKTLIFLVLTVLCISCYNELTARESIGTLDIYRAKKDLVIHGVIFKKGEIVACDGNPKRVELIRQNAKRLGIDCVRGIVFDARILSGEF